MAVGNSITINDSQGAGYTALDPRPLLEYLASKGRSTAEVEKCNRFILPAGKEYGRGWILMRGRDVKLIRNGSILYPNEPYNARDGSTTPHWNSFGHSIRFRPTQAGKDEEGLLIERLGISHVQSVTGWNQDYIGDNDKADPALGDHFVIVEFVDARYIARMTKLGHQAVSGYAMSGDEFNVRSYDILKPNDTPAYVTQTLKQPVDSNNQPVGDRTPWTWTEVIQKLVDALPSNEFNPVPENGREKVEMTNAIFPTQTPQNLRFCGMSVWDALCEALDQTGNTIWRDLKGNWHIESYQYGGSSSGYLAKESSYYPWLRSPGWDLPRDAATSRNISVPEKVTICFPSTRNKFNDYGRTNDGSEHIHFTEVEKTVNPQGYPNTHSILYSPVYADYDEEGTLLNSSELDSIATDMANAFKASKGCKTKSLRNVYNFYQPIDCGSGVAAVQWSCNTEGATTEVLLNPMRYIPKKGSLDLAGGYEEEEVLASENFSLPDVIRKHNPVTRFIVCIARENIPRGGRGLADLMNGRHSGNSDIEWGSLSGNSIQGSVDLTPWQADPMGTGGSIYLHEPGNNQIYRNAMVVAFWHIQTRRWIAAYSPCVTRFSTGVLLEDMCPTEQGRVINVVDPCSCDEGECGSGSHGLGIGTIITAENPYQLSGKMNSKVLMYHSSCLPNFSGSGSGPLIREGCVIVQVQHEAVDMLVSGSWSSSGDCTSGPGDPASCTLQAATQECSVMTCKSDYTWTNVFTLAAETVLADWWVSGNNIYGREIKVFLPCICDDNERVLHTGTDCAYGSG